MAAVCLDASLVLAWLLPEELSEVALALRQRWKNGEAELIAPPLLNIEVPSALRQAAYRGRITIDEADEALATFLEMGIRLRQPEGLLTQAWSLAKAVNAPRLYDMFYVAVAELEGCQLWTADRRLLNLVAHRTALVKWVGDFNPEDDGDG